MVETAEKIHNDFETTGNNSNENKPDDDTDIVQVDSQTKISKINRSAYVKLHRSSLTGSSANSINRIKNKFEINTTDTELMRAQSEKFQVSASGSVLKNQERFKTSDKQQQDENYNDVCSSDEEIQYIPIVRRQSSTETIDDIKNELNEFITMDPKAKEKKKTNLRRIFSWLGKDKKKNQEESRKYRHSDYVNHDNTKNETNSFNRDSTYRHTIAADTRVNSTNHNVRNKVISNVNNIDNKEDEQKFANQHIENFNHIRRSFDKDTDKVKTNKNSVYANTPYISKYIDPNLSTSESDKENPFIEKRSRTRPEPPPRNHYDLTDNKIEVHVNKINNSIPGSSSSSRDTPPRAQETRQNVKLVNPKAYQSTLEAKQEKPTLEETYGTVFDSVENKRSSISSIPKSPKLKLPPNRDTSPLSPRVTSPLPHNSVSTEKIIATELLKNSRSPTPVRKPSDKGTLPSSHQNLQLEFDYPVPLNENSQIPRKPPRIPTNMNRNSAHNGTMYTNSPTLLRTPTPSNLLRPLSPSANSLRSSTPVDLRLPLSPKSSPQKDEIRKSVEAYYWNEIKKMKEREIIDYNLLYQKKLNMENDLRRSRSLSPNTDRSRRSLSLPRSTQMQYVQGASGNSYIISPDYNNSGRAIVNLRTPSTSQYVNVNPNFIRNSSERRTTDNSQLNYENYNSSLYRPIFRRGSLTKQPPPVVTDQQQQLNKKVSFYGSLTNSNGSWPTKNGYTKSPPQRRPDKLDSPLDDDVFLPNGQRMPSNIVDANNVYDTHYRNKPNIYMTKSEMLQMRQRNLQDNNNPPVNYSPQGLTRHGSIIVNEPIYTERPYNSRRMSFDSVNFVQQNLPESYQVYRQNDMPQQSNPRRREIIMNDHDIFGQIGGYSKQPPQNEPIYPQPQPYRDTSLYSSKNSLYNTNNRQVNVRNKVCDFYGQIHDNDGSYGEIQKSGMLMGQLQYNPSSPSAVRQNSGQFVRGTRLTASANDMSFYRRQPNIDARYRNNVYPVQYGSRMDESPNRPLPPVPKNKLLFRNVSDTESASDNSEIQRIVNKKRTVFEEEWNSDGKSGRGISGSDGGRSDNEGEVRGRSRNTRRDDPRRHTLGGDQQYLPMAGQGGQLARTMDLETYFTKSGQPRGYPPPSNAMLFDDDPGIMSEVETSSTGFRRGGKQRSSLPVVRTPSKTLERPLGLVFLQYRNETKRALLPNEITSIDTVKALFVRSFPKQLTMEYLDSPNVKIYIHDSSKDMFYELEDLRSHLREIRDRSVLRLFESADVTGGLPMAGIGIAGGVGHFEDPSYFSEPEFDSEYQHQHIHKSKGSSGKGAPYYMGSTTSLPRGTTLMRTYSPAVSNLPSDRLKTLPTDGYMSSPERGSRYEDPYYSQYASRSGSITPVIDEEVSDTELLDDSYSLYGVKLPPGGPRTTPRSPFPPPTPVPYDATRYKLLRVENMERQLANLTGLVQKALTQTPTTHLQVPGRDGYRGDEFDKNSSSSSASLPDDSYLRSDSTKAPKLGKTGCHKSVSFEKSVSFSDEPPDMNSPKQHSPQHAADTKPAKPAIKSSTLPRTSSQERDRLKPAPPPKPASLSPGQYDSRHIYRDLQLTPEMYNQLRGLQKKAKDLRAEVRNLRRMSQAQAHSVKETIRDTFIKIRAMLLAGGEQVWQAGLDQERVRLSREEDLYKQEMLRLEKDLSELESTVEELRGNVINRKTRVNMSDVENMALILSKSSKTVADLKLRFPGLQDGMKSFLGAEMEKVMREEKFLKEEPERLESALRRCKKLTGTLVTLKRLASVQEQRLPCSNSSTDGRLSPSVTETPPITPTASQHSKPPSGARLGSVVVGGDGINPTDSGQRPENALDALLDELQTFSKPHTTIHHTTTTTTTTTTTAADNCEPPAIPVKGIPPSNRPPQMSEIGRKGSMDSASLLPTQNLTVSTATGSLRRLHSYPSGSDTDNSPPIQPLQRDSMKTINKPPVPERNAELLQHITTNRRVPPPPPPRTSSKSPLASPTSPSLPPRSPATGLQHIQNVQNMIEKPQSQFEMATQNLGLSTLRRNVPQRSSMKDNKAQTLPRNIGSNLQVIQNEAEGISASNSSSCESVNSQDGSKKTRKEELEQRHQELLKKQKALQEQYARLQQLQRGNNTLAVVPPPPDQLLKKTGSESNLLQKMGLQMSTSQMTGSLTNIHNAKPINKTTLTTTNSTVTQTNTTNSNGDDTQTVTNNTTTNKVYETDIL